MPTPLVDAWKNIRCPVVGMLHLPPLPGAPGFRGAPQTILQAALRDAETLAEGGIHGLMLENLGDTPFYPRRVPPLVTAHMTAIAVEIRRRFPLPLGINVLRNDGLSGLAIAHAVGAQLLRVNVLCGARVTDQGLIQGIAHQLLRERARLAAQEIKILADVDVKHSAPLEKRPLEEEIDDTLVRGGADAVILSGAGTGKATDAAELRAAKGATDRPIWVGSGVTPENVLDLLPLAEGLIVGSALKQDGQLSGPIDRLRVERLMEMVSGAA